MIEYPVVVEFNTENLTNILNNFQNIRLISTENRTAFSGEFPIHTRYFSNGDRPFVALIKQNGIANLRYANEELIIPDRYIVFFDDTIPHAWIFKNCDLEIYYYRQTDNQNPAPRKGDYCLDHYF